MRARTLFYFSAEYLYLAHPGKKVHGTLRALCLQLERDRRVLTILRRVSPATAPLVGFAAAVMTLSKTMLYWLQVSLLLYSARSSCRPY